jgi:HAMP domain-containing protein
VRYLSLRFKLLIGFTLVFTLIFAGAYYWFYTFATNEALDRITEDLVNTMQAAVDGIDGDQLERLYEEGEPREDGYTDDPRYWEQVGWLGTVHEIEPRAALYTFRAGDAPNELVFITSSGAVADPQFGATFRESWIPEDPNAVAANMAGLKATTLQTTGRAGCTYGTEGCKLAPYEDGWGQWVSAFAPVRNTEGEVVAALGMDFQADYVRQVQDSIRSRTLLAFGVTYAILFLLVYSLSSVITRPITALTAVAERIGEGNYEGVHEQLARTSSANLFADETTALSQVFEIMVDKVYQREQTLRRQVEELRIEIDETRRQQDVGEIVETDFFRELQAKARDMRARRDDRQTGSEDVPEGGKPVEPGEAGAS